MLFSSEKGLYLFCFVSWSLHYAIYFFMLIVVRSGLEDFFYISTFFIFFPTLLLNEIYVIW